MIGYILDTLSLKAVYRFFLRKNTYQMLNIMFTHLTLLSISYLLHVQKDKKLRLSLNGNRKVVGTLRGYDAFLNVVLEEAFSEQQQSSGIIKEDLGTIVLRGNSIVQFESLERVYAAAT